MTAACAMSRRQCGRVACAALLALLAGLAAAAADISPAPFSMGSRFGRSPERAVVSRDDRFHMGSRFGKRSEAAIAPVAAAPAPLACRYTGVLALYACVRTHRRTHYKRGDEIAGAFRIEG